MNKQYKKVQVGKDQEKAQSERDSHSNKQYNIVLISMVVHATGFNTTSMN